ncbi:hypothetical protein [Enterococcus hulanensis]|uniref:hypothetical protein n=1 Tax=Enterococcus hulanensis TaxID=2559929 RepID=UPI0010F97BBC|nr:hypothetical protein [Enterococcus hulanensis]
MNREQETEKQKVVYILPSTAVSAPMSRMFVLSQYREPLKRMQVCFGEQYLVKSDFSDNIKNFQDDTIYLIPEQFRNVLNMEKIAKGIMVPSNIFSDEVLNDLRRKVAVFQIRRPI